jgi:beta-lactam-binding protein with PASTA domain
LNEETEMPKFENFRLKGAPFFFSVLLAIGFMGAACVAAFFLAVNRPEQMMVPDVVGKELTTAMLEMQVKELYPRLELRYTETARDKGKVLVQDPLPGSIVKAGRRITLVVSQGAMLDKLENYVGQTLTAAEAALSTASAAGMRVLVSFAEITYTVSNAPAGTILAQAPEAGAPLTDDVAMRVVVSLGTEAPETSPPQLVGKTVAEVLVLLRDTTVVFDFEARPATGSERPGQVVWQETTAATVPNGTRIKAILATAATPSTAAGALRYGVFSAEERTFPYAIPLQLRGTSRGKTTTIATVVHPGGLVTIPYGVAAGTELSLVAAGSVVAADVVR